jgi:hypothetical protein
VRLAARNFGQTMDILVLVCALTVTAQDCQPETSIDRFYVGLPMSDPEGCLRSGMLYAESDDLQNGSGGRR